MSLRLVGSAAVVIARNFNLTLVNQAWLLKQGILTVEEMEGDFAFTNMFSQVSTKDYAFVLSPDRLQLQLSPRVQPDSQRELIQNKVVKFIKELPHTPYAALGMNFTVHIYPEKVDVQTITRGLFFVQGSPIHEEFTAPDARFGGYLSKDILGCRLKLEVKPAMIQMSGSDSPKHFVALEFNFHLDVEQGAEAIEDMEKMFNRWDEARDIVMKISQKVAERDKR